MRTREEDVVNHLFVASTHSYMMVFSDRGRAYWLKVHEIPDVGADGRGKSIANLVQMESGEKIAAMLAVAEFDDAALHRDGHAQGHHQEDRAVGVQQPARRRHHRHGHRRGRRGDRACSCRTARARCSSARRDGMAIRFPEEDVRPMGRTAYGVRGIQLREGDEVVAMEVVKPGGTLLTVTEQGYAKHTELDEYRVQRPRRPGLKNLEITDKNGQVVSIAQVKDDEELLVITEQGKILRTPANDIRTIGRATQGVRLMDSRGRRPRGLGRAGAEDRRRSADEPAASRTGPVTTRTARGRARSRATGDRGGHDAFVPR